MKKEKLKDSEKKLYDFENAPKRTPADSLKWDVPEGELPMWVADMDFKTAPEILEAVTERAKEGAFGYVTVKNEWKEAIISWWSKRYGYTMHPHWLLYCIGVMPAIGSTIRCLSNPGEKVAVLSPVYNHFFIVIENNHRVVEECALLYDKGQYTIDWEALEKSLQKPEVTLLLLSNPHNPTGQIWDKETLLRIGKLCRENNVLVLSDEIHCDLTEPGTSYVPFGSISEEDRQNSVSFIAPTKSFNIAGLKTSAIVAAYEKQRHIIKQSIISEELADANTFAGVAAIAAYTKGGPWLDHLRGVISENKKYVSSFLKESLPDVEVVPSDATYLMWLDVSKVTYDSKMLSDYLRENAQVYIADGVKYRGNGKGFLRLNVACPRTMLEDGLNRFKSGLEKYCAETKTAGTEEK